MWHEVGFWAFGVGVAALAFPAGAIIGLAADRLVRWAYGRLVAGW